MNCPHWTLQSQESHFLGTPFVVRRMEAQGDPGQVGSLVELGSRPGHHPPPHLPLYLRPRDSWSPTNLTGLVAAMLEFPFLIISAFPWTLFCHAYKQLLPILAQRQAASSSSAQNGRRLQGWERWCPGLAASWHRGGRSPCPHSAQRAASSSILLWHRRSCLVGPSRAH